jgi:hypothetical protein
MAASYARPVALSETDRAFLEGNNSAAMITVGADGVPKVARVAVALVEGKLWSSGTESRTRTGRLRRDPHCTLFVFDAGWSWVTFETTVRILDGPPAAEMNLRLFRAMQKRPTGPLMWLGEERREDDFLRLMVEEERLIYEFDVSRAYGLR